jgi:uncharacterized protein (UPF0262 family)
MSGLERIASIALDEGSISKRSAEVEHERTIALTDLQHENSFSLVENPSGPYDVTLKIEEARLVFDVRGQAGEPTKITLSIQPLKSTIRDYFIICESYYAALKEAKPHKLEAIDMGRRGIHNEGSELLKTVLESKIVVDFQTARRLFTLICVLHLK